MRLLGFPRLFAEGMVHLALTAGHHLVVLVGAALICHGAAGFAGALAGALALAAAAMSQRLAQAGLRNGLDMLHSDIPPMLVWFTTFIIQQHAGLFKIFNRKGQGERIYS